jgi:WD domain, G-beta repeat
MRGFYMGHDVANVHEVLVYSAGKVTKRLLGLALAVFACGFADVVYFDAPRFPGWPVMVAGLCWAMWEFWRLHNPGKPLLTLSPDGLRLRVAGVKQVQIPWQDVQSVGSEDMDVSTRYGSRTVPNVTVIEVPKRFYDRFIHVGNFIVRGPGWGDMFTPNGERIRIALHHEVLPVEPTVLLAEVEARWNAFRDQPRPATAPLGWSRTSRLEPRVQLAVGVLCALAFLYMMAARSGMIEKWEAGRRERHLANLDAEHARWKKELEDDRARSQREMEETSKRLFEPFDDPKAYAERQKQQRDAAMPAQPPGPTSGHRGGVVSIALSPDGKSFVSAGLDRTVKLWDLFDPKTVRNIGSHKDTVRSVAVLPDGAQVVSAGDDGVILLRRLADGGLLHEFDAREHGDVAALAISRDGRRAASAHRKGKVAIWDIEGRALLHLLAASARPTAVAFSVDGSQVIGAGYDGDLRIWQTGSGSPLRTFGGKEVIYAVAFLPDGKRAVSGGQIEPLRLWDIESGELIRTFFDKPAPGMQFATVMSVAVSADGKRILSGSTDGAARLWDIETGKEVARFDNGGRVDAVAFAPDGTILASGGHSIRLWRPSGQALRVFAGSGG